VPVSVKEGLLQNESVVDDVDDDDKKRQGKRALCWSIFAMAMSIPALIGA